MYNSRSLAFRLLFGCNRTPVGERADQDIITVPPRSASFSNDHVQKVVGMSQRAPQLDYRGIQRRFHPLHNHPGQRYHSPLQSTPHPNRRYCAAFLPPKFGRRPISRRPSTQRRIFAPSPLRTGSISALFASGSGIDFLCSPDTTRGRQGSAASRRVEFVPGHIRTEPGQAISQREGCACRAVWAGERACVGLAEEEGIGERVRGFDGMFCCLACESCC